MKQSPLFPTRKEMYFGWRYLAFQTLILPYLLALLPLKMTSAQLNFLFFSINFLCIVIFFRNFLLGSLREAPRKLPRILLTALIGFCVYYVLSTLLNLLLILIHPGFANLNDQSIAGMSQDSYALTFIGTVILVPLTEECLNRGSVFASLRGRSRVAAYIVSTVLFSLIHINGYIGIYDPLTMLLCFLQYVPAGICLAATYEISGSIFAPVLIHTAVNAVGMLAMR